MLKLVVTQPGQPDQEFVVSGDVATIGRVAPCEVLVDEPYVSKKHLRVLHGTVVVDLGSSNGTYLEGQRLTEAVLLEGRSVGIGQQGVQLRIEVLDDASSTEDSFSPAVAVLENMRSNQAVLEAEVERLRRDLAEATDTSRTDELVARLSGENESLRSRLEGLKQDLEARESDDGDSVQAKLAMQRVERVQQLNENLQNQVDALRAELAEAAASSRDEASEPARGPVVPAPSDQATLKLQGEVLRLENLLAEQQAAARLHKDQTELVRKLRKELESLRAAQVSSSPAAAKVQDPAESKREIAALRAKVAALEGRIAEAPPATAEKASDLFFKLQSDNAELKRKLAELSGQQGRPAEPASASKHVRELMEARLRITALEAELSNRKVTSAPSAAAPPTRAVKPPKVGAAPTPPALGSSSSAGTGPVEGSTRRIFQTFTGQDVEGLVRPTDGPAEEFLLIESLRLLRQVERVVTRVAGDLIQLFRLQTMLPDTVGTYREHVAALLARSDDRRARANMVEYMETLGRWLVASIGAHRKASVVFATKLKEDLSEAGLTADSPLPPFAKVPMLAGSELWKRAQDYLQGLSPDTIDARIDEIAREQAQRILSDNA